MSIENIEDQLKRARHALMLPSCGRDEDVGMSLSHISHVFVDASFNSIENSLPPKLRQDLTRIRGIKIEQLLKLKTREEQRDWIRDLSNDVDALATDFTEYARTLRP